MVRGTNCRKRLLGDLISARLLLANEGLAGLDLGRAVLLQTDGLDSDETRSGLWIDWLANAGRTSRSQKNLTSGLKPSSESMEASVSEYRLLLSLKRLVT